MVYDLEVLRRGRKSILDNIESIEIALQQQKDKLKEYERFIMEAEIILHLHKVELENDG